MLTESDIQAEYDAFISSGSKSMYMYYNDVRLYGIWRRRFLRYGLISHKRRNGDIDTYSTVRKRSSDYLRQWRTANPTSVLEHHERYILKKAKRIQEKFQKDGNR
jgi:hypothetical protein